VHPEVGRQNEEHVTNKPTLVLKCFFLAMAVGLVFSTLLGIYMAFKYNRSRALVWSMLLIGTAIPAGLLAMMG
jgi:ABC-type dipeptide/oligopeptide/nickel transport system permease component